MPTTKPRTKTTKTGINAESWFAAQSFVHGVEMVAAPERIMQPNTMTVEQWDAGMNKWIERKLVWDGTSYVDVLK